jgi:serine/threonine protein kinase
MRKKNESETGANERSKKRKRKDSIADSALAESGYENSGAAYDDDICDIQGIGSDNESPNYRGYVFSDKFLTKSSIGKGKFGEVLLCFYRGEDENINDLSKHSGSLVAVKKINRTIDSSKLGTYSDAEIKKAKRELNGCLKCDKNEKDIIKHLNSLNIPQSERKYLQAEIVKDTHDSCIVLEYCYYSYKKGNLISRNVGDFLCEVSANFKNWESCQEAEAYGFRMMLNGLITSMVQAQNQLHQNNILHGDTAARNFMVAPISVTEDNILFFTKIIDFGLSSRLDDHGACHFLYDITQEHIPWPIYISDTQTLNNVQNLDPNSKMFASSIHHDLFSMKATILEVLGYYMGMKGTQVFDIGATDKTYTSWRQRALKMNDRERLTIYLNTIEQFAGSLSNKKDVRGTLVKEILDVYRPYLTYVTPPSPSLTLTQIIKEQGDIFAKCQDVYRQKFLQNTENRKHQPREVLYSILPDIKTKEEIYLMKGFTKLPTLRT